MSTKPPIFRITDALIRNCHMLNAERIDYAQFKWTEMQLMDEAERLGIDKSVSRLFDKQRPSALDGWKR